MQSRKNLLDLTQVLQDLRFFIPFKSNVRGGRLGGSVGQAAAFSSGHDPRVLGSSRRQTLDN